MRKTFILVKDVNLNTYIQVAVFEYVHVLKKTFFCVSNKLLNMTSLGILPDNVYEGNIILTMNTG